MTKAPNPCNTELGNSPFCQRAVPDMMKSTPRPFARLLPILWGLLGVGLLTLLVRWVGWEQLRPLLVAPRWEMVALSLGFSALLIGISCVKWQLLLAHLGTPVGLGRLIPLYLIGILFNQILPSNVGGDVVRGYGLGRLTSAVPRAFATVFLERFTGFVALVACAWVGALIEPSWLSEPLLLGALVVTTATLGGALLVLLDPRSRRLFRHITPERLGEAADSFADSLALLGDGRLLVRAMALSFGFYALTIGNVWVTAGIFDMFPPVSGLAIAVPMVLLVSALPVAPGALGLQEGAFVICLVRIGVPPEVALATALGLRAKVLLLGLIGAGLFATARWEDEPGVSSGDRDQIVSPTESR